MATRSGNIAIWKDGSLIMDIETLRDMCRALPAVTEDIKWGHDLCFSVAGKMFCVAGLEGPLTVSFKVKDEEFDELSNSPGMRPAATSTDRRRR